MTLDDAIARYEAGDPQGAVQIATAIDKNDPGYAEALNLRAVIALSAGQYAEAETLASEAISCSVANPILHNTLGNALVAQGRGEEAVAAFMQASAGAPEQPDILCNLANAERLTGRYDVAVDHYRQAIVLRPGYIAAYNNLAVALKLMGDAQGAATVLIEAVAHDPASAELRFNLGNALHAIGRRDAAEAAYRKAVDLAPRHADSHSNLGMVLAEGGRKELAEASFRTAIALNPDLVPAYVGLADLADDGTLDAVNHRRAVLALNPKLGAVRSSLLMCLHYISDANRALLFEEHKAFGALHDRDAPPAFDPDHDFSPERKLRVGFVSGDFRFHAMLFFALPVLKARDRENFEVICYSTTLRTDAETPRFRAAADQWRDVRALSSDELASLIARDRVDILMDLSGHAPHNRLTAFAAKPAPLQMAWGDYVDTRGLRGIDVLLGDAIHTPAADDGYYVERVVRFAPDYICYQPPVYAAAPAPPAARANGYVTFGSFSEITKIGAASLALWAQVLKAVPTARFLVNNYLLADSAQTQRLIGLFKDAGIAANRLIIRTGGPHPEFLKQYAGVDAILDTAPYSGGLTTCEALLMGVPVFTVPGEGFCGRHAAAHLTHGGFPEGVAASQGDLVIRAQTFAANAADFDRAALSATFLRSRVCDVTAFAADFYGTLRAEWRKRCEVQ